MLRRASLFLRFMLTWSSLEVKFKDVCSWWSCLHMSNVTGNRIIQFPPTELCCWQHQVKNKLQHWMMKNWSLGFASVDLYHFKHVEPTFHYMKWKTKSCLWTITLLYPLKADVKYWLWPFFLNYINTKAQIRHTESIFSCGLCLFAVFILVRLFKLALIFSH